MSDASGRLILARSPRGSSLRDAIAGTDLAAGAWLVGGAVRDAVLDRPAGPDLDVAVEGDGVRWARALAALLDGEVRAEHALGTATIVVDLPRYGGVAIDVASCRTERYDQPGALPTVQLGASIERDLARRDVAANAVAVALAAGADGEHAVVDPHGGLRDIELRRLRVLHDGSFRDDPTRILRVARYAGRLAFHVDEHARALAIEAVRDGALATISADRLRAELELVLREPAWEALTYLASWGVVERLEPRLEAAFHPPLLLRAIDDACGPDAQRNERAWPLRLASLVRPLGDDAASWLAWLGFPAGLASTVVEHVHVLEAALERGDELLGMRNSQLYVELGELRDESLALVALALDDDAPLVHRLVQFQEVVRAVHLHVRGDDVIAAGVPAGPRVGELLGSLLLRSLDGELKGEADERRAIAQFVSGQEGGDDR